MASVFRLGKVGVSFLRRCTTCKIIQCHSRFLMICNINYANQTAALEEKINLSQKVHYIFPKEHTVEELLSISEKNGLSILEAVNILAALNKLHSQEQLKTDIKTDARFLSLCEVVGKECHHLGHNSLIGALRSLQELGTPSELPSLQSVQNEVMWKARKMNFKNLTICLKFQLSYQETKLQKQLVEHICKIIKIRWYDIVEATDVIKLLQLGNIFDDHFLARVEDRALEFAEKMTSVELHKLLCLLAQLNRRPTSLLRAISFHLNQRSEKLTVRQMINTLFALNSLNFPDYAILQRISDDILPEISSVEKPNVIFSVLTTVGQVKWRHTALLEECGDWIQKHIDCCRPQELVAYVLALARLNYLPEEADTVFKSVLPRLTRVNIETDILWLDVVWSLAILNLVTKEHLFTVLHPQFYCSLIGSDDFQATKSKMKLLNLIAIAKVNFPTVPCLACESELHTQMPRSDDDENLSKGVLDALSNFVPKGKYMESNLNTSLGIFIDAEFIIDRNGKPVPLSEFGLQAGYKNFTRTLPEGFHRVALLVWNYKDFTLNSHCLLGINVMSARLLKNLGYTVIEVPYTEYSDLSTAVKRIQYLQQKIKECTFQSRKNVTIKV